MRRATLIILLAAAMTVAAAAQQARDVVRRPLDAAATGQLSGRVVVDGAAEQPVRRALVHLSDTGSGREPEVAITDDNGRFAFAGIAPGAYTLTASRPAFVTAAYGAKSIGKGSGTPISIGAGQALSDITLHMLRGAVITGRVLDASGQPVANADVNVVRVESSGAGRRLQPQIESARTDARGEYRIFGLAPGAYVLRLQPSLRAGELRVGSSDARPVAYAPSYYPGTPDADAAGVVTLAAGEERAGLDFTNPLMPTSTVSGTIVGPNGQAPVGASISLQREGSTFLDSIASIAETGGFGGSRVSVGGTFSISGLVPGTYRVMARARVSAAPNGSETATGMAAMMPGLAGAVGATLWASTSITLAGQDASGLVLSLQEGLTLVGRVEFAGAESADRASGSAPANRVAQIMLVDASRPASSTAQLLLGSLMSMTPAIVDKDGAFRISGLVPGRYRLSAAPPGSMAMFNLGTIVSADGWALKSAMSNGRDLADGAFEITDPAPADVVVTFTKATTEIRGRVLTADGQPTGGFPIVVFATERAYWTPGSRRVTSAKPASDGTYRVRGLPPGQYYVCALSELDPNDLLDPSFLEQLAGASFTLTLAPGEARTQDLRLGGGD